MRKRLAATDKKSFLDYIISIPDHTHAEKAGSPMSARRSIGDTLLSDMLSQGQMTDAAAKEGMIVEK